MKNKPWREAGLGGFEIVFILALVGFILGMVTGVWQNQVYRTPTIFIVPWISSIALVFITAPACLAGWLGKIISPDWEAPLIRKWKYRGAVVGFTCFLALIVIPNVVGPHTTQSPNACINHLRLIDSAKQQWALEQRKQSTDTPAGSDLQPYLGRGMAGELPYCELDTSMNFEHSYSINNVGTKPTCKISPLTHVLP